MRLQTIRTAVLACAAFVAAVPASAAPTASPPQAFDSTGSDRRAIQALLDAYTQAVSTKDQAAFEALLLTKTIPFSYVPAGAPVAQAGMAHYEDFRHAVFEGAPFTQRFTNVRIDQDGSLANVTLVFINTDAKGESWGWKTLQLLKTPAGWKIASEFFTVDG